MTSLGFEKRKERMGTEREMQIRKVQGDIFFCWGGKKRTQASPTKMKRGLRRNETLGNRIADRKGENALPE